MREVLTFYRQRPDFLPRSMELEDTTRAAACAALRGFVPLAQLLAELGRLAAEAIPADPGAAREAGWAMARWAAREYHDAAGAEAPGEGR